MGDFLNAGLIEMLFGLSLDLNGSKIFMARAEVAPVKTVVAGRTRRRRSAAVE